ncbi:MAG: TonB family protein [Bryobacteraceae bacterium]
MFEQTFVQTGKTHTTATVLTSFGVQIVLLGFLVMIPLIWFDELPGAQLSALITAPPPPPPPPPPPQAAPPKVVKVIPRQMDAGKLMQPKVIPKEIKQIQEDEAPSASMGVAGGVPGGVSGGPIGGVLGGILGGVPTAAPPPPKKAPPPPPHPAIIPVGGRVQNAKLIRNPQPIYPQIAKSARISGTVELSAIIGEDGHIQELKVVSGHPLLRQAALDAVKQWVYQPTLLNEQAVKVSTTIDVIFTLSQ